MVGLAVTAIALLVKSRHRMRLALVAGLALAAAVEFMPEHWHDRIASIFAYEEDASAQGRFESWRYALEVAREHPVVGGGFESFSGQPGRDRVPATAAPTASTSKSWGEHGWVGLALFLALGIGAYLTARSVIRRASEDPELSWAADLAAMVQVSIAAYAIAGLFLNLATFDLYYHLIAIVVIASSLVRKAAASEIVGCRSSTERRRSSDRPMPAPDGADESCPAAQRAHENRADMMARLVISALVAAALNVWAPGSWDVGAGAVPRERIKRDAILARPAASPEPRPTRGVALPPLPKRRMHRTTAGPDLAQRDEPSLPPPARIDPDALERARPSRASGNVRAPRTLRACPAGVARPECRLRQPAGRARCRSARRPGRPGARRVRGGRHHRHARPGAARRAGRPPAGPRRRRQGRPGGQGQGRADRRASSAPASRSATTTAPASASRATISRCATCISTTISRAS